MYLTLSEKTNHAKIESLGEYRDECAAANRSVYVLQSYTVRIA